MINSRFKKIYKLTEKLQQKHLKQDYEKISKIDDSVGTFEEYVDKVKKEMNREVPVSRKKRLEDVFISRDNIEKENITLGLYLFHYQHTDPIKFDDSYKILPLTQKEVYEYGVVATLTEEDGYYNINGLFGGIDFNEDNAKQKYNELKNKLEKMTVDELLDEIEKLVLEQLNA